MQKEKRRGNRRGGQSTGREIEIGRPSRRRERALEPHLGLALHRGRPGEDIVDHDVRHREAFARRASRGLGGVGGAAPKKRRPRKNLRLSKKIFSSTINSIVRSAEDRLVRAESDEAFERPHTSSSAPRRPVGVPHSLSLPPPRDPARVSPVGHVRRFHRPRRRPRRRSQIPVRRNPRRDLDASSRPPGPLGRSRERDGDVDLDVRLHVAEVRRGGGARGEGPRSRPQSLDRDRPPGPRRQVGVPGEHREQRRRLGQHAGARQVLRGERGRRRVQNLRRVSAREGPATETNDAER